ncbi:SRPBCC domain-containing protein [Aquimarina gracilis]|uniref:SRPBCC domain-containing protein n=1 Tax=Aquimarina gracilis TaxID=874422 RepID=A0ABU5ZY40_9FLAO|nr:SRPBCC domain-containing protein [Aquimarina gracilis]MEB3346773.1 SRPBCC domain-containing protein [Aquimarina gracilis]
MKAVVVEEIYNASIEMVWKALTDKEEMKKWYFDLSEFKPKVGFEFQFTGQGVKGDNYLHLCKITEVIPLEKLQYSWQYENLEGYSLVTFELFEEENKTRLKLTHSGIETFPQNNSDFDIKNFEGGWAELLTKLLKKQLRAL